MTHCLCVVRVGMCIERAFMQGDSCASSVLVDLSSFVSMSSPRCCSVTLCVALSNLCAQPE